MAGPGPAAGAPQPTVDAAIPPPCVHPSAWSRQRGSRSPSSAAARPRANATAPPPAAAAAARATARREICRGFFGPPAAGIFSESLQATIYDAGCLVLAALPAVGDIEIDTPNIHYLPAKLLDSVGEAFEDDVFLPTSEPSGSINCVVARNGAAAPAGGRRPARRRRGGADASLDGQRPRPARLSSP